MLSRFLTTSMLALTLGMSAAHAAQKFATPYEPSGMVMATLDERGSWAELYPLTPAKVPQALVKAEQGDPPANDLVAVALGGKLHFGIGRLSQQLPLLSTSPSRGGEAVEYDDLCVTYPQPGDRLQAAYGAPDNKFGASLDVKVVRYYSLSEESDTPLDLSKPGECKRETHSRLFLSGTLTLTAHGAKQQTLPVLMQVVSEPNAPEDTDQSTLE